MTLKIEKLETELTQGFTSKSKINIVAIRPNLLKYGNPTGEFFVELRAENGSLLAKSEELDMSEFPEGNYFWGRIRLYLSAQIDMEKKFFFHLVNKSLVQDGSNYLAWIKDDFGTNEFSGENLPFDYEVWVRTYKK